MTVDSRIQALGEAVHVARLAKGWSKQKLADACRVSRETVLNIERGTSQPRFVFFLKLVDVLKLDTTVILKQETK